MPPRFISYPTEVKFGSEAGSSDHGGRDMIFFNVVIALTSTPVERVGQLQQQLALYAGGDEEDSGGQHRTHHNQIKVTILIYSASVRNNTESSQPSKFIVMY